MHPGVCYVLCTAACIYMGRWKQRRADDMYDKFTRSSHAVMFAKDISARGLDFRTVVDWVVAMEVA